MELVVSNASKNNIICQRGIGGELSLTLRVITRSERIGDCVRYIVETKTQTMSNRDDNFKIIIIGIIVYYLLRAISKRMYVLALIHKWKDELCLFCRVNRDCLLIKLEQTCVAYFIYMV